MEMEARTRKLEDDSKKMARKTWKDAVIPHLPSFILLAFVVAGALHLTLNNGNVVSLENLVLLKEHESVSKNGIIPGCNLFSGRWVYDNVSYPLYKEGQCSFMENHFACEKYGKKSLKYQSWRWQPYHCDIPRFDGSAFLEKIRGKKVLYVGDSLCRNQWKSMLCLIESYLPPLSSKTVVQTGNLYSFHSIDYNATIGFYWAPMLVESNCDDMSHNIHGVRSRTIRIKSIEKHGRHWIDADILVFDSFAWWMNQTMTILWGSFDNPDAIYKEVEMKLRRYEIALSTWSDWLEIHINRSKTKIFFMSHSPFRLGNTVWKTDGSCYNETEPFSDETYWPNAVNRSLMHIAELTIEKLEQRGLKVEYLNITQLSGYREDARPSIYKEFWGSLNKKKFIDPAIFSDCLHWCLPGVPDIWNQILYAYLMKH